MQDLHNHLKLEVHKKNKKNYCKEKNKLNDRKKKRKKGTRNNPKERMTIFHSQIEED